MTAILKWAVNNLTVRSLSKVAGGILIGLWIGQHYHVQIKATLADWGIAPDVFSRWLVLGAGALIAGAGELASRWKAWSDKQPDLDGQPAAPAATPFTMPKP